jgi:hypothetical protein
MQIMQRHLRSYDVDRWARSFLADLAAPGIDE